MRIKQLNSNWYLNSDSEQVFDVYLVGSYKVVEIIEHKAQGAGDKWYYDVLFENGNMTRVFNPNEVFFEDGLLQDCLKEVNNAD